MRVHCHNGLTPETESRYLRVTAMCQRAVSPRTADEFSYRQDGHSNHAASTCSLHNRRGACHVIAYFPHLTDFQLNMSAIVIV